MKRRKTKLDSQNTTDFLLAKILLQLKINQDLTLEWLKAIHERLDSCKRTRKR